LGREKRNNNQLTVWDYSWVFFYYEPDCDEKLVFLLPFVRRSHATINLPDREGGDATINFARTAATWKIQAMSMASVGMDANRVEVPRGGYNAAVMAGG